MRDVDYGPHTSQCGKMEWSVIGLNTSWFKGRTTMLANSCKEEHKTGMTVICWLEVHVHASVLHPHPIQLHPLYPLPYRVCWTAFYLTTSHDPVLAFRHAGSSVSGYAVWPLGQPIKTSHLFCLFLSVWPKQVSHFNWSKMKTKDTFKFDSVLVMCTASVKLTILNSIPIQ